jgi:hypothetical protein
MEICREHRLSAPADSIGSSPVSDRIPTTKGPQVLIKIRVAISLVSHCKQRTRVGELESPVIERVFGTALAIFPRVTASVEGKALLKAGTNSIGVSF